MAAELIDIPTEALLHEVQRRIECSTKPEQHVVLIGDSISAAYLVGMRARLPRFSRWVGGDRPSWMWEGNTGTQVKGTALLMSSGDWRHAPGSRGCRDPSGQGGKACRY